MKILLHRNLNLLIILLLFNVSKLKVYNFLLCLLLEKNNFDDFNNWEVIFIIGLPYSGKTAYALNLVYFLKINYLTFIFKQK